MAAVDVVMPAPPPPPPPPPPAPVVRINRLALAAIDAVLCLWVASLWVLLASVAAALIGGLACGSGCTGAAWTAVLVSLLFFAVVWPLAAVLLSNFEEVVSYYVNQIEKGAAALEPISEAVVNAHLIAITAFPCLELLGLILLLDANDPLTARIASVITVLPPLGICVMCCLVSIPGLAVRVWRIIRHGRASVVPI